MSRVAMPSESKLVSRLPLALRRTRLYEAKPPELLMPSSTILPSGCTSMSPRVPLTAGVAVPPLPKLKSRLPLLLKRVTAWLPPATRMRPSACKVMACAEFAAPLTGCMPSPLKLVSKLPSLLRR